MPTLWTIGYERLLPPELLAELEAAGVQRLIDVRYRPQSRRPGMSKTRLGDMLADRSIAGELRARAAPRTALLCLEADPAVCHRRQLAELLAERLPGLKVVDL